MTRQARRRGVRVTVAAASALALATGLTVVSGAAPPAPHAAAGTTGVSPEVFVDGNGASHTFAGFPLQSIQSGNASPDRGTKENAAVGPIAINTTATKAVIGVAPTSAGARSSIVVFDVTTGATPSVSTP